MDFIQKVYADIKDSLSKDLATVRTAPVGTSIAKQGWYVMRKHPDNRVAIHVARGPLQRARRTMLMMILQDLWAASLLEGECTPTTLYVRLR